MATYFLKAEQLADRLQVKPATIYRWCERGLIPYLDFGEPGKRGCIRFDPAEIASWLETRRVAARKRGTRNDRKSENFGGLV